ncbi:MAG: carbohydrate ABC transporter permease [Clostridia bacterium]|nr:carbohydrate ABC transporter permease [Clostridia bacterium]
MESTPVITKETKKSIHVDYEGKLSFKDRLLQKLKASNTWIKLAINIVRFILMLGVSYVIINPFLSKIAGSFMSKEDVIDSTVLLIPKHFSVDIYKYLFLENHYLNAFINTLTLSLICAVAQTLVACLVGYGLSKFKFKGNKIVMAVVLLTMVIPHNALRVSFMQHFSHFDLFNVIAWDYKGPIALFNGGNTVSLSDTYWPLALMSITGIAFKNGLYIYMMRQFFKGVPDELEESAYVDGSGVIRTFFQIILPLSIPMMITIFLFSFSWQWTDEFYANLFFTDPESTLYLMPDVYGKVPKTLSNAIKNFSGKSIYQSVIRNTAGLMIIAPLIIMYLFCQKFLVQGIERSGLVG